MICGIRPKRASEQAAADCKSMRASRKPKPPLRLLRPEEWLESFKSDGGLGMGPTPGQCGGMGRDYIRRGRVLCGFASCRLHL